MTTTQPPSDLLTSEQLANRLQVPRSRLKRWRRMGTGPAYLTVGRSVRYDLRVVEEWLASRVKGTSK